METAERIYKVSEFKTEIKKAVAVQRGYKNQRKTVNLVGNREIPEDEAAWKHGANRTKLAAMYIAYGVMRGKDLEEQIKAHASKRDDYTVSNAKNNAENMLSKYKIQNIEAA